MAALLSPSKQRNEAVFAIALTELFVLLLFLVVFLWIATVPRQDVPRDLTIEHLERQVEELERLEADLRREVQAQKDMIRLRDAQLAALWQLYKSEKLVLTPGTREWEEWLKRWMIEVNKGLEAGGRGHSNCLGKGAVGTAIATDDGIEFVPGWTDAQSGTIALVPSFAELSKAGVIPVRTFERVVEPILTWSDGRKPRCRFDILFRDVTTQKKTYVEALRAIDRVFYKSQIR